MKTVFISGASRGLGAIIANTFASNNYNIIINYNKSEQEAIDLKKVLENKYNIKCYLYKCDVSNELEVKEIDCLGKEFDPALEQAVVVDHDETKESGVVTVVLQKGYMYKDRVLRTAMVKVNE